MVIYYRKKRQLFAETMKHIQPLARIHQNQIKTFPFDLAPAESEYADELETDPLNYFINAWKY